MMNKKVETYIKNNTGIGINGDDAFGNGFVIRFIGVLQGIRGYTLGKAYEY